MLEQEIHIYLSTRKASFIVHNWHAQGPQELFGVYTWPTESAYVVLLSSKNWQDNRQANQHKEYSTFNSVKHVLEILGKDSAQMGMQFHWRSLLQQHQHWSKHAQVVVSSYFSHSPTHDCYESEGLMTQTCNWTHIGVLGSTSCIHLFFVQSSIHAHLRQKTTPTLSVSEC